MTKLSKQNAGGIDYLMVGCAVEGTCAASAASFIKAITLTDTDIVGDGMTLVVQFTNETSAGTAPEHITLYSSDQVNYYLDPQLTQAYGLAPAGCYQIEYTGEGNAYDYISYPVLQVGGIKYPVCRQNGKYVGGTLWQAGDKVSFLLSDGKMLMTVVPDETADLSGKVDKTTTVNGHPLSSNVVVTKSDVGLGNVVNTGDSATPVQGGTTKFTTGGAYTELNKKVDKTTTVNGHALSGNVTVSKSDVGLGSVVNTGDSATPVQNGTDKFTTGGAYTELAKKVNNSEKGAANGVATLDASGRVPYSQLPESAMEYEGKWDASTNTPTLKDGTGVNGEFYIVSVGGTVNFGTESSPRTETFAVDDRVIYDGSSDQWDKLPAGNVRSVNGETGDVQLDATDIPYDADTTTKAAIDSKVSQTTTVNGHALSGNVTVSKSDVGLGNVANTGDSATPVSGGTTKFTTGGAYTELNKKVDKETGKGLSSNDFTDALKTKLDGIEAGAQVNSVTGVKGETETNYRTGNVDITKSNVGLSNVVNTGDSATPAKNGTDKFTTGGAYTELAKKVNKTTTVNGHALSSNVTVTKSDVGLGNVANTGDSAVPAEGGTDKFTTGGAFTELAKKVDKEGDKVLSTNDFTNADKVKLNGIEEGAQVNTVTGVKGSSETNYRTGDISISKSNIGLGNVVNTGDSAVPSENGTEKFTTGGAYIELNKKADKVAGATNDDVALLDPNGNLKSSGKNINKFAEISYVAPSDASSLYVTIDLGSSVNLRDFFEIIDRRGNYFQVSFYRVNDTYKINVTRNEVFYSTLEIIRGFRYFTENDKSYLVIQGGTWFNFIIVNNKNVPMTIGTVTSSTTDWNKGTDVEIIDFVKTNNTNYKSDKADLTDLAPAFSASASYAVGDYVTYNGNMYRCIVAHSGAWSSSDFTLVTVGSDLALKADKTSLAVPTDAVLHYSFDEVPDIPDGTADERYLNGNTYDVSLNGNGTVTTDPYVAGDNKIHKSNVNGNANYKSDVSTGYTRGVYRNFSSYGDKIVVIEINAKTSNLLLRIEYRASQSDNVHYLYPNGRNIPLGRNKIIFVVPSNYYSYSLAFYAQEVDRSEYTEWELLNWYIGNGSYSTPIINNTNGQNNATNNGGIATNGVSGKGLLGLGREDIVTNSTLPKPTDKSSITLSGWVKHSSNYNDTGTRNLFGTGAHNGAFCIMQHWSTSQNSMRVTAFVRQDSTHQRSIGVNVTKNEWHHFAMVWENKILTFYVDGIKYIQSALNISDFTFGGNYWRIGDTGIVQGNEPSVIGTIEYYVDDAQIFDRALSDTEVLALYQNKANTPKYYTKADMVEAELTEELDTKQPKTLDTPVTVGGAQQTTVEEALGALAQASSADTVPIGTVIRKCGTLPAGYINCGKGEVEKFVQEGSTVATDTIKALLQTADGAIYAGVSYGGLYKSTNGSTLTQLSGFPIGYTVNALLQSANGTIYVGTGANGIYKSTDGITFTQLTGVPTDAGVNALLQTADGAVYVGLNTQGIYKSTDGSTFTRISDTYYFSSVNALIQTADGAIYVGTYGIYKSTDGITFTQLTGFPSDYAVYALLQTADGAIYAGTEGHSIYKSADGSAFTQLSGFPADYEVNVLLQTADGAIYANAGGTGIFKSTDESTFARLTGFPTGFLVYALLQTADGAVYAGAGAHGIYKSIPFRELDKTTYADLYAVVGDKYNFRAQVSDNTKFAIPLIGDDDLTYGIKY